MPDINNIGPYQGAPSIINDVCINALRMIIPVILALYI